VLYRQSDRLLILLHVFAKRSAKIPEGDIRVARDLWAEGRKERRRYLSAAP
jgi:phage-related protein